MNRSRNTISWKYDASIPNDHFHEQGFCNDLVVIGVDEKHLKFGLSLMFRLSQNNVVIGVPAALTDVPSGGSELAFACLAAGCTRFLTSPGKCGQLAELVQLAASLNPRYPVDWRAPFVKRLPWNPVSGGNSEYAAQLHEPFGPDLQ